MSEFKKHTRITIFIDHDNFTISYCEKFKIDAKDMALWDVLSDNLLKYYKENFVRNDYEIMDHTGTFLCVGMSDYLLSQEERELKKKFQALDRKPGFIVRYGYRTGTHYEQGRLFLGKEKGVDSEIICQMLMGAFLDHYDVCILLSDDNDYIPAIRRVQEYFGKKVIHAGFRDSKLRNQAYAHIPFEDADKMLTFGG